ncbi:protein UL91 [Wood mouse herpesvirus]|uniref:Protein UL91 n=1 Tax=Wood mouse herpesvirus TaxID=432370 RepID=D0U1M0_9GAMA|nr:protein UL91 [Wood mouse herpesvirus]ACY41148.1 protein UL91 [Wood mouse herpesvirus]
MSAPGYSVNKSKTLVTEQDLLEVATFFNRPLRDLIAEVSKTTSDLELVRSTTQGIENICLLLDLVGTECIKDASAAQTSV